jgi:DNA-directed RNA polymerase subunit alpha
LEVETDGTITPEEAFFKATEILTRHFTFLGEPFMPKKLEAEKEEKKPVEIPDIKVQDLKLSARTINALLENNIKTVAGILRKKEQGLLALKGLGKKGVKEIKKALKKLGFELT